MDWHVSICHLRLCSFVNLFISLFICLLILSRTDTVEPLFVGLRLIHLSISLEGASAFGAKPVTNTGLSLTQPVAAFGCKFDINLINYVSVFFSLYLTRQILLYIIGKIQKQIFYLNSSCSLG